MPAHDSFGTALDTTSEAWSRQIDLWRAMTAQQKAQLVSSLSRAARRFAEAGIAARYPNASPRDRFLRLAILQLGDELAAEAYPEAARLQHE
jgi:hypothetical protein